MMHPKRIAISTAGRVDPGTVTIGKHGGKRVAKAPMNGGVHVHIDRSRIVKRSDAERKTIARQRLMAGF